MIIETKDKSRPRVYIPDGVADRETRAAVSQRWKYWACPYCGCAQAGYDVRTDAVACSGCVQRLREGKALMPAAEVWAEAMEAKDVRWEPLSEGDLDELAELKAMLSQEAVLDEAEDPVWIQESDGSLRRATCAVCRTPIGRASGGMRLGAATFYCPSHALATGGAAA